MILHSYPLLQASCGTLLSVVFHLFHASQKPFKNARNTLVENVALFTLDITFIGSILAHSEKEMIRANVHQQGVSWSSKVSTVIGYIIVILSATTLMLAIVTTVSGTYSQIKRVMELEKKSKAKAKLAAETEAKERAIGGGGKHGEKSAYVRPTRIVPSVERIDM